MLKQALAVVMCTMPVFGLTITVQPGDALNDSLSLLGSGDTLYLSPGTYSNMLQEPILSCTPEQSGVTIISDQNDRAVLDGGNMLRPVMMVSGPCPEPVLIKNLVVTGGNATGSQWFNGGGIHCNEAWTVVSNCLITGNMALIGGGIGVEGGKISMAYCTLSENEASVTGGGIDLYACELNCFSTIFTGNVSSDDGGGLNSYQSILNLANSVFTGNTSGDDGGGATILQGSADLEYLTIHGNTADDDGGGLRIHTIDYMTIRSSIITSNLGKGGINVISSTKPVVSNVCCWDNDFSNYHGMEDPTGSSGNISVDPLYADSSFNLSQTEAGQQWNSPAVDAGHESAAGSSIESLSTRTDSIPDSGTADMGYHHININQTGMWNQTVSGNTTGFIHVSPSPAAHNSTVSVLIPGTEGFEVELQFHDLSGRLLHRANVEPATGENASYLLPGGCISSATSGLVLVRASWSQGSALGKIMVLP